MIYIIKKKIRNLAYRNKIFQNIYSYSNVIKTSIMSLLNDSMFAKLYYKENTGKSLSLKNPVTFNEKLWWLKINNRDPLLTKCSDKVKVREYLVTNGLGHILNESYGVYNDATEIDFNKLPEKAFIKTNHGSGTNILWDRSKPFNKEKFIKKFNRALDKNYYSQSREWNYKNIDPKIIVEKVLVDKNNEFLIDYRFLCFDGKVKLVFVDIETAGPDGTHSPYAKRNVYDKGFNLLNIKAEREHFEESLVSKPDNFQQMIEYAERLSHPFVFCRVDFYNIDGNIYFGEITFYPGSGTQLLEPQKWENKLGDWIDLNSKKIVLLDKE